jgi:hypothetical protein
MRLLLVPSNRLIHTLYYPSTPFLACLSNFSRAQKGEMSTWTMA